MQELLHRHHFGIAAVSFFSFPRLAVSSTIPLDPLDILQMIIRCFCYYLFTLLNPIVPWTSLFSRKQICQELHKQFSPEDSLIIKKAQCDRTILACIPELFGVHCSLNIWWLAGNRPYEGWNSRPKCGNIFQAYEFISCDYLTSWIFESLPNTKWCFIYFVTFIHLVTNMTPSQLHQS